MLSSKLIPMIFDLRNELAAMVEEWKIKARAPGASRADKGIKEVLVTMSTDFKERWGDAGRLQIDKEGKGRQPKVEGLRAVEFRVRVVGFRVQRETLRVHGSWVTV